MVPEQPEHLLVDAAVLRPQAAAVGRLERRLTFVRRLAQDRFGRVPPAEQVEIPRRVGDGKPQFVEVHARRSVVVGEVGPHLAVLHPEARAGRIVSGHSRREAIMRMISGYNSSSDLPHCAAPPGPSRTS
jgi:hypothetical protein